MKRFLILTAIFVVMGLFFNTIEGHTMPTVDDDNLGEICGLPPLNTAGACCMEGDATSMESITCDSIVAPRDGDICWCVCENGMPICDCADPVGLLLEFQIYWHITEGRSKLQEVRI